MKKSKKIVAQKIVLKERRVTNNICRNKVGAKKLERKAAILIAVKKAKQKGELPAVKVV